MKGRVQMWTCRLVNIFADYFKHLVARQVRKSIFQEKNKDRKNYISFGNLEFIGDFSESKLSGMVQLEIRLLRLKDKMECEKLEMED